MDLREETPDDWEWVAIRNHIGRAIEAVKQGWTQEGEAFNYYGNYCSPRDCDAFLLCATGALENAAHDDREEWLIAPATQVVGRVLTGTFRHHVDAYDKIIEYNDAEGRTKEEILALLDDAWEMTEVWQWEKMDEEEERIYGDS